MAALNLSPNNYQQSIKSLFNGDVEVTPLEGRGIINVKFLCVTSNGKFIVKLNTNSPETAFHRYQKTLFFSQLCKKLSFQVTK